MKKRRAPPPLDDPSWQMQRDEPKFWPLDPLYVTPVVLLAQHLNALPQAELARSGEVCWLYNHPIRYVKVGGLVIGVDPKHPHASDTRVSVTLDDGTGLIECVHWKGFRDAFSILEHGHAKPLLCEVNVHGEWLTLAVLKALRTRKYAGVAYNTSAPFVRRKGRGHVGYMAQPVGFIPFPRRSGGPSNLWTIQGLDRKSSRALQDCDVVLASMEGPDSEARAALLMDLPRVLGRVRRGATSALLLLHGAQGQCPSGHNETYVPVMGRYLDVTGTLPAVPCWEAHWEALAQRGDVLDGACSQAHGRRFCLGSLRTDSICNAAEPCVAHTLAFVALE
ncbi:hypothetical protein Ctob_013302 [Chrysochromulina tobinii]|uniref:CST complex subunit Stn1 N-terminal domain-containing protein n=1 Tax=Chrysochromulina tobinii TaxID=1460289 RepID=A0A0M0K3W6_9EUKA|nr:hypothetical protein Ctob_013302 [Chrysochromulina tobinii]|eukprot:KOO33489.1 hypothetical protein Ctob_013302 [Chrysochromulina sp. CCMP291]